MKKIVSLLFAIIMVFSLVACDDATVENVNTEPQATPTEEPHTHSYEEEITNEATCTTEGTKAFTCACGEAYTEPIPSQHVWGQWQMKTAAMVGKNGTETRTCSLCSASESQERTLNAIANSFYDTGLVYFGRNDKCILTGPALVHYALTTFPEFRDTPVKSTEIFGKLMDRFSIPEQLVSDAKRWGAMTGLYDEANDTFKISYDTNEIEDGNLTILGYVHQGENKYAVYFSCNNGIEDRYCEFVLEYNRLNGSPNYYVSSGIVDTLPENMVKCAEGEQVDIVE